MKAGVPTTEPIIVAVEPLAERGLSERSAAGPAAERSLKPLSASGSTATMMGSVVGTPAFMSPEQASGRLDLLGPASDVYSLGATLYALLTGKPPVENDDVGQLLARVA